ncbi:MAG: TIM barrel protein [Clostridia bacterium]|nr:TIM barrel protein [Clostridia bacterium]
MSAKFGPGGNSDAFRAAGLKSTLQAPRFVRELGLEAYEYEAGNGITGSNDMFLAIGMKAREHGIKMSFHAPYFISLSSVEKEKRNNSVEYIRRSAEVSSLLGADTMVVHCGSCAKISRETAMEYASETLEATAIMMQDCGYTTKVGIETMGKVNQLGTLDEVLRLCKISKCFAPVVDFGHLNARDRGVFYTADDYKRVFDTISAQLGASYAENLHCHFSKIMYTEMGEKKHLTLEDDVYGPQFEPLAEAIVSLGVSPTIICESAGTQSDDAVFMKMTYEREKIKQNKA